MQNQKDTVRAFYEECLTVGGGHAADELPPEERISEALHDLG